MNRPDFFNQAACTGHPPELFIPNTPTKTQTEQAKQICNTCPVKQPCLQYALEWQKTADLQGIFGGTTARERKKLNNQTVIRTPRQPKATHGTLYTYRQLKCRCIACKAAHARTINRQRQTRRKRSGAVPNTQPTT